MTEKELIKQLKNLKSHKQAGALDKDRADLMYKKLMSTIEEDLTLNPSSYLPKLWFLQGFGLRNCFQYAVVTCLVLMIGVVGCLTTVSASFNSLPGDTLYAVKLTTERIRLALAEDEAMKISLRTEFAGRRIDEAKELIESSSGNYDMLEETLLRFNEEVSIVNTSLQDLGDSIIATGTIKFIDEKIEEFNDIIVQNAIELPQGLSLSVPEELPGAEEGIESPLQEGATSSPELPETVWEPIPESDIPEAPKKIQWQIIIEE